MMKFSITITLFVIATACGMGWHQGRSIARLEQRERALAARLRASGIDPAEEAAGPVRYVAAVDLRERRQAAIDGDARKLIRLFSKDGESESSAALLMGIDADRAEALIEILRGDASLRSENFKALFMMAVMKLAEDRPQKALAVFAAIGEFFTDSHERRAVGEQTMSLALSSWAKSDPLAVADWLGRNEATYGEYLSENTKKMVLTSAAAKDPSLAFSLIGRLHLKDKDHGLSGVVAAARTHTERSAILSAMRKYVESAGSAEEKILLWKSGLEKLAAGAARDGIGPATRWVESMQLAPADLAMFSEGLAGKIKISETGEWIDWFSRSIPAEKADVAVRAMTKDWVEVDYKAAGQWLSDVPAGPSKNSAIRAYAESVVTKDPGAAEKWALTLPAGEERQSTIRTILENWPNDGPENEKAAAAFAERHGLR